ncbi:MAG TPA: DUF1254 domain-containing protein [Rubrivivax sp.]|nr:DUF1254 domain-containing protein [Rubrivivax sp.]
MKTRLSFVQRAAAVACGIAAAPLLATAQAAPTKADWRETYAYTQGMQAFVFGFPWAFLPEIRWKWVTQDPHSPFVPYAPLNQFYNSRQLTTAEYRDGGSPNNDTLYSVAWLDLSKEPLILSVPDVGDRYYTMEMGSLDSDNFAYVGKRTTGTKAGHYAIVGPNWKGTLPAGVTELPRSRTDAALILGRTLVTGPDDVAAVNKIQDQYKLTPLSLWGSGKSAPASRDVPPPANPKGDPLASWKTMNAAMTANPPAGAQAAIVRSFADIGIGPGLDVSKTDAATQAGLARAAKDGMALLRDAMPSFGKQVNGWKYPPQAMGRAGLAYDFLLRASLQCLGGIISNDTAEAIYMNTFTDAAGATLSGAHTYKIRFAPGGAPPVGAFWSITMYGLDNNFVANPINRYKLGSLPKGSIATDPDGGMTITVSHQQPAAGAANWLPAPQGDFYLVLRTYMPEGKLLDQSWAPPPVIKTL